MTLLRAEDVWVAPGQASRDAPAPDPVVRGVSLEVRAGEWVGVTGPNGGGKTSLLLALAGLWPLLRGTVMLDGAPLGAGSRSSRRLSEPSSRSSVAVILQDPSVQLLQPTVADELVFAARNLDRPEADIERAVERWTGCLELSPLLARDPRTLSAGQQQLVVLAGALVAGPRLLLADEPGAHLDPGARQRALAAVGGEVGRGLGVVWVTQDPDELARAGRVIRLGPAGSPALPGGNGAPGQATPLLTLRIAPARGTEGPRVATSRPLEIPVGRLGVTALTGPNGAGKTVILAAAAGWAAAPQVSVTWHEPPEAPPILAAQYPELQLFEEIVADEVAYAAVSRGSTREGALELAAGHFDALGVGGRGFLARRLWTLSGGERRIAALAAALVAPAGLVVLDEPTAGLDPGRSAALSGLLGRVARSTPLLVASQDTDWVSSLGARTFEVGAAATPRAPSLSEKTD